MGILDKIIDNTTKLHLENFDPTALIDDILSHLKPREKDVIVKRFGLGVSPETLESVGKQLGLTRERVRQIEKQAQKFLREHLQDHNLFKDIRRSIAGLIETKGGAVSEKKLLQILKSEEGLKARSLIFVLELISELERVSEKNGDIRPSWIKLGFELSLLRKLVDQAKKVLKKHGKPIPSKKLIAKLRSEKELLELIEDLSDDTVETFLEISTKLDKNIFGEFGLSDWTEINPKDVGDKAYIALKYSGKPEHYSAITELINKLQIGRRTAYKETVHNELIKDPRFVLVGRGIYALAEWGYKKGVVVDVIEDILKENGGRMEKNDLISEVSKRRMVRKNTILVGLANKNKFKKVGKNTYELVTQ